MTGPFRTLSIIVVAGLLMTGCQHRRAFEATQMKSVPTCRPAVVEPPLVWIDSAAGWTQWMATNTTPEMGAAPPTPSVDFTTHGILIIRLKDRSSAGTHMALHPGQSIQRGDTAIVTVRLDRPVPSGRTAQMIVSPCLMIRLSRTGYASVRVVVSDGRELGTLTLPQ